MIRSLCGQIRTLSLRQPHPVNTQAARYQTRYIRKLDWTQFEPTRGEKPVFPEEEDERYAVNSFLHHRNRNRPADYQKFESPRKRASKMYTTIMQEAIQKAKEETPEVWKENFRTGDAIELEMLIEGGKNSTERQHKTTLRGVILGIFRKKLDYSINIRDVVDGEEMDIKIPLHSPMVKSVKILQKNFVFKGKRYCRRAKLFFLRDRNPALCAVTGTKHDRKKRAMAAEAFEKRQKDKEKALKEAEEYDSDYEESEEE